MKIVGYRTRTLGSPWIREILIEDFGVVINPYGAFIVRDFKRRLEDAADLEELQEKYLDPGFIEVMVWGIRYGESCAKMLQDAFGIQRLGEDPGAKGSSAM